MPTTKRVPKGTEKDPIVVKPEPFEEPKVKVSWTAPARLYIQRKPVWFLGLILLGIVTTITLLLLKQFTFALAVAAFIFLLFSINSVEPSEQDYAITTYGVKIGKKTTKYEKLKWFWFGGEAGRSALYISTFLAMPHILELPLPVEADNKKLKDKIQEELLKYIPYHEEGEHDWLNTLDNIIYRTEQYLPKPIIRWYLNKFHKQA